MWVAEWHKLKPIKYNMYFGRRFEPRGQVTRAELYWREVALASLRGARRSVRGRQNQGVGESQNGEESKIRESRLTLVLLSPPFWLSPIPGWEGE